jgi:hypothetical protein
MKFGDPLNRSLILSQVHTVTERGEALSILQIDGFIRC